jgi:hypothetical protein
MFRPIFERQRINSWLMVRASFSRTVELKATAPLELFLLPEKKHCLIGTFHNNSFHDMRVVEKSIKSKVKYKNLFELSDMYEREQTSKVCRDEM